MLNLLRPCLAIVAASIAAASLGAQSVEFPAASPAATIKQRVGLTDIEVVYSRPSLKGREIFGGLEAWGKVWRTGANAATKISFSTPVKFGGTDIPAGTYLLFSIPNETEWTVILQQDQKAWGAYTYDAKNDVARVTAKPSRLAEPVESFLIDFNDLRDESATLNLLWERTKVSVPLAVELKSKLMPQIAAAMAAEGEKSAGILFQSAAFYYDHGGDLNDALTWVTAALEQQPKAFYMAHLQAKILAKLGRKAEAIAAANHSTELAVGFEGPQSSFIKLNRDLIAGLE